MADNQVSPPMEDDAARLLKRENRNLRNILSSYNILLKHGFSSSLASFTNSVLRSAIRVTGGEAGSLMLYDTQRKELYINTATHLPQIVIRRQRVKLRKGIAGWVAYHKRPLLLNDLRQLPQFRYRRNKPGIRSALSAPLLMGRRLIGVINIQRRRSPRRFTNDDLDMLMRYATQLALALENHRLQEGLKGKIDLANRELAAANLNLQAEQSRLKALLRSIPGGVLAVDSGIHLTAINRTAREDLALPAGLKPGALLRGRLGCAKLEELLVDCLRQRVLLRAEISLGQKLPRFFIATVAPFKVSGGTCAVAVLHDITKLKEIDRLKSDFLSMCSHELRTPLTSISALSELMMTKEYGSDSIKEYSGVISEESKRLTALINNILDITSIEAGTLRAKLTDLDTLTIIKEEAERAKQYAATHEVRLHLPEKLPPARADEGFLRQVLSNLISNAVKYSPGVKEVLLRAEAADGALRVSVTDHGIGIKRQDRATVFERFYRVHSRATEAIGGTGLGLYIVKYLVEAMGGRIYLHSTLGQGSTFTFTVPLAKAAVKNRAAS